jgi:uncharacterized protein YggE
MYNYHSSFTPIYPQDIRHQKRVNGIEVIGEGTVTATPDQAQIIVGVWTEDESVSTAQQQNAAITASIINALVQLGIPKENIQSNNYQVNPQYRFEDNQQILIGYRVQHELQVTINEIEQVGMVIDTAIQHGANIVSSISFRVKQPQILYLQALKIALKNGYEKAKTIANTIKRTIDEAPYQVVEISQMPFPQQEKAVFFTQAAQTPIEPGRIQITATVKMKFNLL